MGLLKNYRVSLKSFRDEEPFFSSLIVSSAVSFLYVFLLSDVALFSNAKAMLEFPNIYDFVFWPWFTVYPKLIVVLSLCLVALLWISVKGRSVEDGNVRLILSVVLVMCVIVGTLKTGYVAARYTFFLYPLFLILIASFVVKVAVLFSRPYIVLLSLPLAFVFMSEDF